MNITKRIKLDFGRSTSPITVWVKQGDENSRRIEVEPLLNGMAYTIPNGVSARFACKKPDGHQVLNDYPTISGNIITVPLTPQTLAAAGEGLASVILFDNANQSILSTQNFILRIEENPLVGSEVESSDEYQSFLSALDDIGSGIESIEQTTTSTESQGRNILTIKMKNGETSEFVVRNGQQGKQGNQGNSIIVSSVSESIEDNGENVVTFSDGKALTVRNGSRGRAGVGVTVIRESNYLVAEEEGTVLATKMTPAQLLEAAQNGIELHVRTDDNVDWRIYQLNSFDQHGSNAIFTRTDHYWSESITVVVSEDGTMTTTTIRSVKFGGDNSGTTENVTLFDGIHTVGSNPIHLEYGTNLQDYAFFVVEGQYMNSSYPFRAIGIYQPSTYIGSAIGASTDYYTSGDFLYHISLTLSTTSRTYAHVSLLNSSSDSISTTVYITKIIGYKF